MGSYVSRYRMRRRIRVAVAESVKGRRGEEEGYVGGGEGEGEE